ncbi:MAG: hypothetical protein ACYDD5_00040 [Sulfuricurvum sp.]
MKSAVDKTFMPTPEEIKTINSFFLIRYISNDPSSIYIANMLNCNYSIPIEAQYNFVRHSTLNKVSFINYPKKEKLISDKDLKIIMRHFKINEIVAKDYIKILGTDKTKEILDKYSNINI